MAASEVSQITASTSNTEVDFGSVVDSVIIKAAGDIYIAFDEEATTDNGFLVESTDGIVEFEVPHTILNIISSGTPKVYICAYRS